MFLCASAGQHPVDFLLCIKVEHEYQKPVGIVTHRSKYWPETDHCRSEPANLRKQVLVASTC